MRSPGRRRQSGPQRRTPGRETTPRSLGQAVQTPRGQYAGSDQARLRGGGRRALGGRSRSPLREGVGLVDVARRERPGGVGPELVEGRVLAPLLLARVSLEELRVAHVASFASHAPDDRRATEGDSLLR